MKLLTESYQIQNQRWPQEGRHILAQFDQDSVIVYQAYRPAIGHFAAKNQYFGGDFSLDRMSWIKPNFLWMMYRSSWGQTEGQTIVLAVRLKRKGFDQILAEAVHSSFVHEVYSSKAEWQKAVSSSSVRLQWDPDHNPSGNKVQRRAIQLGLRGDFIARYSKEWIVDITDLSGFVAEQRENARSPYTNLITPREEVYPVYDDEVRSTLGLSDYSD